MSHATTLSATAEQVLATLRAHEPELRAAGIRRLSLFGSVPRGDDAPGSDVDLAAELDPAARIGLFALAGLERRIGEMLGRKVDLLPEPVEKPRPRANIERDRVRAFWRGPRLIAPPAGASLRHKQRRRARPCPTP
jgi:predicted nucleotidyltransferase